MSAFAKSLFLILFLCCSIGAQTVRMKNNSPADFVGWKRTTIDSKPSFSAGEMLDGTKFALGRSVGKDLWVVDIWTKLGRGESRILELADFKETKIIPYFPPDIRSYFGGSISINSTPLFIHSLIPDGAGWTCHLRSRLSGLLHADAWVTWYPTQPEVAYAEVIICASNPAVPAMSHTVSERLSFSFGDAIAYSPGRGISNELLPRGTIFADGQARVIPLTLLWARHVHEAADFATIAAITSFGINAVGISKVYPDGNPPYPANYNSITWTRQGLPEALSRVHNWVGGVVGPATYSPSTGAQEDQVFRRQEPLDFLGAEVVTYLSALKMAGRPCHHLALSGDKLALNPTDHSPRLILWDGRAHWHEGVSPNRLGKPRNMQPSETEFVIEGEIEDRIGQWWGPDVEHNLVSTLTAAARYTGSPACQWLLEHQAVIYHLQYTTERGWANSDAFASRATGWEGILAVSLYHNLENRNLAESVKAHWLERSNKVIKPARGNRPGNIWDVRVDDPRLGSNAWWMPWQQSIGSYGLWLAGTQFGDTEAVRIAYQAALTCVNDNWIEVDARWRGVGNMPWTHTGKPDSAPYEHLEAAFFTGPSWTWGPSWFESTWDIPAVFVVLKENPENQKAKAIWSQMLTETGGGGPWFPPGHK